MVALLILCLTALLNCLASLSLKAAASSEVPNLSTVNAISAALIGFGPYVRFMLLAILFWVSAFFVYFWALRTWPASQAYAITTGITISGLLLSEILVQHRTMSLAALIGVGLVTVGVALISRESLGQF